MMALVDSTRVGGLEDRLTFNLISDRLNAFAPSCVETHDEIRPQQDLREIAQQAGGTPSGGVLHFDARRRRARACSSSNNRWHRTGVCGLG